MQKNKTEKAALSASRRPEKLTWETKITFNDKVDDYLHTVPEDECEAFAIL